MSIRKYEDFSIEDLLKEIKKNGYMCYGFGRVFKNFFKNVIMEYGLYDELEGIIDSDYKKYGFSELDNKRVCVCSLEQTDHCKNIIITTVKYNEVFNILEPDKHNYNVYLYSDIYNKMDVMDAKNVKLPDSFRLYKNPRIPKIIHYCWFGNNPIPDEFKKYMESWKKYCPDYVIKEWNEYNYDISKNAYMYSAYKAKKWGFVPDYARLDIIYNYGGIYLDTDVELIRNLDDFLYEDGFAGFEPGKRVAFGLGFGAQKGLEIIKELRDSYDDIEFVDFDTREEFNKTMAAPKINTIFLKKKYKLKWENNIIDIEGLRLYPLPVLCGMIGKEIVITDNTYSIHHYASTWMPDE